MAATYDDYTGNGSLKNFDYTFPVLKTEDVKVSVDGVTQTSGYTVNTTETRIEFTTAPANLTNVRVYRETYVGDGDGNEKPKAVFAAGSSIRAKDLNANTEQALFGIQELQEKQITNEDVSTTAEIAVSKLADGTARQLLQTDSAGTGVEWTSNVDIPGTLDVTGNTTFDGDINLNAANKYFRVQNGSGVDKFFVDSDNGNTTIRGTLQVDNTLVAVSNVSVLGNSTFYGDTTIGNSSSDTVTIGAKLGSNLIPNSTSIDLGASSTRFGDIFGTTLDVTGTSSLAGLNVNGNIDISNGEIKLGNADEFSIKYDESANRGELNADRLKFGSSVGSTLFYFNDDLEFAISGVGVSLARKLYPDTTNTIDLGIAPDQGNKKWRNIYAAGTGYFGSLDVTGNITAAGLTGGVLVDASEHSGATANDTTVFSTAASDARYFIQTASSDEVLKSDYATWPTGGTKDSYVATPGAIDKRIIQIVDDVGGFVAIANEGDFPASHPDPNNDAGTIISITALSQERTASGSGVLTTGFNTVATPPAPGDQVTINGCGNGQVFAAGYGLLVQTTSTLHTYDFVRYVPNTSQVATVAANSANINTVAGKATEIGRLGTADAVADMNTLGTAAIVEDMNLLGTAAVVADMDLLAHSAVIADMATIADTSNLITNIGTVAGSNVKVTTVADNINSVNDFADKYRIASSAPGSNNDDGDLYYNTTDNKLYIYNGSSWDVATELNATGGTVQGDTTFTDNTKLQFGTGNDLKISHDGTNNRIDSVNGHIYLRVNSTENAFKGTQNGNVEISYDGVKKLETTSTGVLVTELTNSGNTTFNGDYVTFSGTNTAAWDKSNTRLLFNDNAKAAFGTGADLEIYHDGTHSFIKDTGTGSLKICSNSLSFRNAADGEDIGLFLEDGRTELYFDNSKKIETIANGVQTNGSHFVMDGDGANGNPKFACGNGADLNIYHDGTNSNIYNATGELRIRAGGDGTVRLMNAAGNEHCLIAEQNGGVELYYDNVIKLQTRASDVWCRDDLIFADSDKIKLGDGSDLEIVHDGTDSFIGHTLGSGLFRINAAAGSEIRLTKSGPETLARFIPDGAVELMYDNSKKFSTDADGFQLTGQASCYLDLNTYESSTSTLRGALHANNSNAVGLVDSQLHWLVKGVKDANVELYYDNVKKLQTSPSGFQMYGHLFADDDNKIQLGTSQDLQIWADGSNSYIQHSGDGDLFVQATGADENLWLRAKDDVNIQANDNENAALFKKNGAVELYYDNSLKLSTQSYGTQFVDAVVFDNPDNAGKDINWATELNTLRFEDDVKATFGGSDDLQIYNDGHDSYIKENGTGDLKILTTNLDVRNVAADESILDCHADGAVNLFYDSSKKLETTSTGVTITSPSHDGGLKILPENNNQESRLHLQGKAADGTAHDWYLSAQRNHDTFSIHNGTTSWLTITDAGDTTFAGDVFLPDAERLKFGNSVADPDLQIYHVGGGHSYVSNHTNNLYIQTPNYVEIGSTETDGSVEETSATFTRGGASTFYWDDVAKLATKSNGATVYGGNLTVNAATNNHASIYAVPDGTGVYAEFKGLNSAGTLSAGMTTHAGSSVFIDSNSNSNIHLRANGTGDIELQTNGSVRARVTDDGICFNADTAAANALDDYEEGTWVATCANSVTLHDGDNLCSYTKIGRQVTVNGQVRVNSDNSNAVLKITSLPFNSADLAEGASRTVGSVRLSGIDVTNSTEYIGVNCNNSDGSTNIFFTLNQDNAGTADLLAKADGYVMFTMTYFTA